MKPTTVSAVDGGELPDCGELGWLPSGCPGHTLDTARGNTAAALDRKKVAYKRDNVVPPPC